MKCSKVRMQHSKHIFIGEAQPARINQTSRSDQNLLTAAVWSLFVPCYL
jgi:hypothetical protein